MPSASRTSFAAAALAVCAALAGAASSASAQSAPPKHDAKHEARHEHAAAPMNHHMSGWKEMDAYHMLMMATWHPAKGKNELAPARAKADSMAAAADAWARAAAPAACADATTRRTVAGVAADSRAFAALARTDVADARLKSALSALHDRFETVEKSCQPGKPAAAHH